MSHLRKTGILICGIGVNDADYPVSETIAGKKKFCPFYEAWSGMLRRCYSVSFKEKHPRYKDCSTTSEWHSFMTFKQWMETQDYVGKHLDKDLLLRDNKLYSPETCLFVTHEVNSFMTEDKSNKGDLPTGVTVDLRWKTPKYKAMGRDSRTGKAVYLGQFSTPELASSAYKTHKQCRAIEISSRQNDLRVSAALIHRYELPRPS